MNIVRVVFNKNFLATALLFVSSLGAVRYALSPTQFMVVCDQRLASDVQAAIKKFVTQAPLNLQSADSLCKELQKLYPAVRAVSVAYKSSLRAHVQVQAYVPSISISSSLPGNKEYILCKDDKPERAIVIEKKYFNEQVTSSMPTVVIEGADYEEKRLQPECIECMRDLKSDLLEEYLVIWRSKSEIIVQYREVPITLIADIATIHESEKRNAVKRIFTSDAERYKDGMQADIRLRDSVICAPLKGT